MPGGIEKAHKFPSFSFRYSEDIELNITTQQGLKSFGFDQGPYMIDPERSNESEYAVHHFHTKVYEALNAHARRQ